MQDRARQLQQRFQSTLPTRGSDHSWSGAWVSCRCFNPRSPRGGATDVAPVRRGRWIVSIHAPHEGERRIAGFYFFAPRPVSIHAPHEGERRYLSTDDPVLMPGFNPRSPRGGATLGARARADLIPQFQSTLPTRGSDDMQGNIGQLGKVSIHAPHEGERPLSFVPCGLQPHGFNPRSPRGGATKHGVTIQDVARSFNPRSPRGGATMSRCPILSASKFQSTLPTRGSDAHF